MKTIPQSGSRCAATAGAFDPPRPFEELEGATFQEIEAELTRATQKLRAMTAAAVELEKDVRHGRARVMKLSDLIARRGAEKAAEEQAKLARAQRVAAAADNSAAIKAKK